MESEDLSRRPLRPRPQVDAPGFLFRWRWRLLLAALLTVPFFVPVPRELQADPIWGGLGDRLHVVLLGLAMLFLYWFGPLRGRLFPSVAAAAILGGAIELLQILVGRHARWHDLGQDLIGIGIALGFVLWRGAKLRLGLALMIALILFVPWQMREIPLVVSAQRLGEQRFPLLADFETRDERVLWTEEYDGELSWTEASPGGNGALRLKGGPSGSYPAAVMFRFPSDWSAHDTLKVDVRLARAQADSVRGGIVLTDYDGYHENIWLQKSFHAVAQWRTVSLSIRRPLNRDRRPMQLDDVFLLKVYLSRPPQAVVLEIDNLRLE